MISDKVNISVQLLFNSRNRTSPAPQRPKKKKKFLPPPIKKSLLDYAKFILLVV